MKGGPSKRELREYERSAPKLDLDEVKKAAGRFAGTRVVVYGSIDFIREHSTGTTLLITVSQGVRFSLDVATCEFAVRYPGVVHKKAADYCRVYGTIRGWDEGWTNRYGGKVTWPAIDAWWVTDADPAGYQGVPGAVTVKSAGRPEVSAYTAPEQGGSPPTGLRYPVVLQSAGGTYAVAWCVDQRWAAHIAATLNSNGAGTGP